MPASITLSRGQFWAVLGTLATGLVAIIGVLIGVVYNGLAGGIARVDGRIEGWQNSYNQAVGAAADVKHVLTRSRRLFWRRISWQPKPMVPWTSSKGRQIKSFWTRISWQVKPTLRLRCKPASFLDWPTAWTSSREGGSNQPLAAAVEAQKSQLGQIQQRVDRIDTNLQRAPWILDKTGVRGSCSLPVAVGRFDFDALAACQVTANGAS